MMATPAAASDADPYADTRRRMVAEQLEGRGITDPAVLRAMRLVPRERFVLEPYRPYAYDDSPLPIPANQTISQPYIVAYMIAMLRLSAADRVLEIGAGSGYAAAVMSRIAAAVYSVERHAGLVDFACQHLAELGYDNVQVRHGDGTLGWPDHAPYDAIIVAAGGPSVPETLRGQLAPGGRLIMPIGRDRRRQTLVLLTRDDDGRTTEEMLVPVAFVPLIGDEGW
jgi:protein-L-isoaspartate(D-aspartate) O-methyltransferase